MHEDLPRAQRRHEAVERDDAAVGEVRARQPLQQPLLAAKAVEQHAEPLPAPHNGLCHVMEEIASVRRARSAGV